jgi:hypothetical protein
MELTNVTMGSGTLVAFTLRAAGDETHYTMRRKPGETLADVAARLEAWLQDLRLGKLKPSDPIP